MVISEFIPLHTFTLCVVFRNTAVTPKTAILVSRSLSISTVAGTTWLHGRCCRRHVLKGHRPPFGVGETAVLQRAFLSGTAVMALGSGPCRRWLWQLLSCSSIVDQALQHAAYIQP